LNWIVDVLPHDIAPYMDAQMGQAGLAMQKAFFAQSRLISGVFHKAGAGSLSARTGLCDLSHRTTPTVS
jgi:hypothetical protein